MEQLLHYVWKHKIFPLMPLQTTSGQPVEVIDPGLPNTDAGPDFFNAKLKINGTLWWVTLSCIRRLRTGFVTDITGIRFTIMLFCMWWASRIARCTMPTAVLFPSYCCTVRTMSAGVMTNYVRRKYTSLLFYSCFLTETDGPFLVIGFAGGAF